MALWRSPRALAGLRGDQKRCGSLKAPRRWFMPSDRIQIDPWQAGWIGWVLVICGAGLLFRHRYDPALLAVTVLPLVVTLFGYAFWVADYDDYYYVSLMPAAVLTFQFGLTSLTRAWATEVVAATLCVVSIAILPVRLERSTNIHRMPGYGGLVDGSKQILKRDMPFRAIRADFLPPESDPEFLFRILGGTIDPHADWVASVSADGAVSYELVSPG